MEFLKGQYSVPAYFNVLHAMNIHTFTHKYYSFLDILSFASVFQFTKLLVTNENRTPDFTLAKWNDPECLKYPTHEHKGSQN